MMCRERPMRLRARISLIVMTACLFAEWAQPGHTQDFPSRVVKIVVPAVGGSTTDALARIVAEQLSHRWGKSVIIENIAGGAMNIGATAVARAAPDGHTLLLAPPS